MNIKSGKEGREGAGGKNRTRILYSRGQGASRNISLDVPFLRN